MSARAAPQVLTSREVADRSGMSHTTICRWARDGRIKPVRKLGAGTASYVFDEGVFNQIAALQAQQHPTTTPGATA